MNLALNEDQRLIQQSAADFLAEGASSAKTRAAAMSESGMDRALWRGLAELGWCGVHLGEDCGGLGLGLFELVLLQEQLGRRLACVPFFDSVVCAASVIEECGGDVMRSSWLPDLASGEHVVALAVDETGHCRAEMQDGYWRIDGLWPRVSSAGHADVLVLQVRAAGQPKMFVLPVTTPGLCITPLTTLDPTRRVASVSAEAVRLADDAGVVVAPNEISWQRARCQAAIVLAAEQVGVAAQCLDLTLAYTAERVQFERVIASFQAIKHRCAQMMVAVESARSAVYGAARSCHAGSAPKTWQFNAALALCSANEAAQFCAQEAIQLHGGVGFTWEYDPHLYFKRAHANAQRLGANRDWLEHVAGQLLDGESS